MTIPKWQHKLARYDKRGKLVSYFLNNGAKKCLYGLKISENIEIGHFFQSRTFLHLSSNLHTSCLSAFKKESIQKQSLADVPQNRCSSKFFNIQRKRSVLEPLFNKVAGLHLSMNIANFVWKTSVAEVQ